MPLLCRHRAPGALRAAPGLRRPREGASRGSGWTGSPRTRRAARQPRCRRCDGRCPPRGGPGRSSAPTATRFFAEELAQASSRRATGTPTSAPCPVRPGGDRGAHRHALARDEETLADAAVIGVVFWRGALEALGAAADSIDEGLLELESRQLVRAVRQPLIEDEEEFAFSPLAWSARSPTAKPRGVRARKHAAFARWLQDKVGERGRGDLCDVLAGHFAAAAELARAVGDDGLAAAVTDRPSATSASPATARWASTCARRRGTTRGRSTWPGRTTRRALAALAGGGSSLPGGPLSGVGGGAARGGRGALRGRGPARRRARGRAPRRRPLRPRRPRRDAAAGGGARLLDGEPPCAETVTVLGKLGTFAVAGRRPRARSGEARGGHRPGRRALGCRSPYCSSATAAASAASWATSAGWTTTRGLCAWPASAGGGRGVAAHVQLRRRAAVVPRPGRGGGR